jgi:hypothetical protein
MCAVEITAIIRHDPFDRQIDFSEQNALGKFVDDAPHASDDGMDVGMVGRVKWYQCLLRRLSWPKVGVLWIVTKLLILQQIPDRVSAKAVDTVFQPKSHDIMDGFAHFRASPIEVRLLFKKRMIVVLSCLDVVFPARPTELRNPVVRRSPAW